MNKTQSFRRIMGNVSGKRNGDEAESSGAKNVEEEEYMEFVHSPGSMVQYSPLHTPRAYQSPLIFTPQNQSNAAMNENTTAEYGEIEMPFGNGIPTMITWRQGGNEVAVEGSWDDWQTRDYLQRTDKDFSVMKMLPSGIYHFRFIVDGEWRYAPDFPHECDDMGRVFNVLDLKDVIPEVLNNICWPKSPPSPASSYNSAPFSYGDFNEKLPDLPPLLQQTPLNRTSLSRDSVETLQKPLPAVLEHLYFQKGHAGQSMVALSSTHRFRSKYVSLVLFKSLKDLKR
ncbi:SNF1-related protein kinase regulatory subunit beta-2-like [Ipomoea triloba]|uniref:SNF1-related protein kinase regulatory subunit beta-2-like n=1 Tax=Ipomoea triloba TaxID=35885 RepID=UPI00125D6348|nr:SNF1-related protein kinase regulatory subunit beta-2-like [Ipomoea triloba]